MGGREMSLIIRKANLEDAQAIAAVHVASWQTTYRGIMKDSILDGLTVAKRTPLWEKNISLEGNTVLVAQLNNQIIGFADGSATKEDEYPTYEGDVTCIYFYQEYQGMGYGKKLLLALFEAFKTKGYQNAIVKVLEDNNSKYFYESLGAKQIDEVEVPQYGDGLTLLVYAWEEL